MIDWKLIEKLEALQKMQRATQKVARRCRGAFKARAGLRPRPASGKHTSEPCERSERSRHCAQPKQVPDTTKLPLPLRDRGQGGAEDSSPL